MALKVSKKSTKTTVKSAKKVSLVSSTTSKKVLDTNDVVLQGVLKVCHSSWHGTMTELLTSLKKVSTKQERSKLPVTPSNLRLVLNRIINRIRNKKISLSFYRLPDYNRTRYVDMSRKQ